MAGVAGQRPGGRQGESVTMKQASSIDGQPLWHAPKLRELGNLRDFVRVGNAIGKSGDAMDGNALCGGEAMGSGDPAECPPS